MTKQQNKKPHILLIDDDSSYIKTFTNAFAEDFTIATLQHPNQIPDNINLTEEIDLILLDFDFSGEPDGLKFLASEKYMSICNSQIPVILITLFAPHEPLPHSYSLTPNDLHNYGKIPKLYKQEYDYNNWLGFIKKHLKRKSIYIYINYANSDKLNFDKHFYPTLKGLQNIYAYKNTDLYLYHRYCKEIAPGDNINQWQQFYHQSAIILHWVTPDLLADEHLVNLFSNDKINIPILARHCLYEYTPLGKLLALPGYNKFLFDNNGIWSEQLCLDVANGIKEVIDKFLNPSAPPQD